MIDAILKGWLTGWVVVGTYAMCEKQFTDNSIVFWLVFIPLAFLNMTLLERMTEK